MRRKPSTTNVYVPVHIGVRVLVDLVGFFVAKQNRFTLWKIGRQVNHWTAI